MRTLRRRYLLNSASTLLALGLCAACGSAGNGDYIELFPPDAGTSGASGSGGAGGSGGSGNTHDDAGVGGSNGAGGSESSSDAGVEPGVVCQVAFVSPAPGANALHLGSADDVDGAGCGSAFETRVRVASNAAHVALWVNDTTNAGLSQDVEQLTALFPNVQLSNTGNTPNVLKAVATMPDGRTCEAVLDTQVLVDCDMPSCTIVNPSGTQYLNASEDSSIAGGFQVDFEVGTELENAGQPVLLTLDGAFNQRLSAEVQDQAGDGVATFAAVPLQEGRRLAQAECRDVAGNVAYSSLAEWIVDITPCTVALDLLPNPITTAHDLNDGASGLQLEISGTVSGDGDCAEVVVGPCGAETFATATFGSGGEFSVLATLSAEDDAALQLCAKVSDHAGNIGSSTAQTKRVRVTPPMVAITSPTSGSFNHATDLNGTTPSCEIAFSASCSDDGVNVELRQGNTVLGNATCNDGVASFPEVSVASRNNGSTTNITARQTADGLTGDSAALVIQPDCQAPLLSFPQSLHCGGQLSITGHDVDDGTSGLQYPVSVLNDGVPDVTLSVSIGGGTATEPPSTFSNGAATLFGNIDFGSSEATAELMACATDLQGNEGCSMPCAIELRNIPLVTITQPAPGATLVFPGDDCGGADYLQVQVNGTVDAIDGSQVEIQVGSTLTTGITVQDQEFQACVNAFDDGLGKILTVTVTDDARPLVDATASIAVNIDGNEPTSSIDAPLVVVQDRREGRVSFSWDAVTDEGGGPLAAYQVRCAPTAIEDEPDWDAAAALPFSLTPQASGTETVDLEGFRVGTTVFCAVRGQDLANNLTPLPANASSPVTIPFLTQEYTSIVAESGYIFTGLAPIGDINGDTFSDFIYGLEDHAAQIFFGGPSLDTTPDVTIEGPFGRFAAVVTGVGDINGDGRSDFAIGAWGENGLSGSVYLFFGRAADEPWDETIEVSAAPCIGADVCIRGTSPGAALGWDISAGDFDGDSIDDLVLGARFDGDGRVYVINGGPQLSISGSDFDLPNAVPANDLDGFLIEAPADTANFGISVTVVGSGADNRADLVIGATGSDTLPIRNGAVAFIPGQVREGTGLETPATLATIFATGAPLEFGGVVRGIGDFNGDGTGDVAVSVSDGAFVGRVDVFTRASGNGGFDSGSVLSFENDTLEQINWGAYLASGIHPQLGLISDLDKDNRGELLIGAFGFTASADLFYGRSGATGRNRSEADHRFVGGAGDLVPIFVGDLNGDTYNDIAVLEYDPVGDPSVTPKITVLY